MPAALLQQGRTAIRDSIGTLITHVAISDDSAAFALAQVAINPTAGATSTHVEAETTTVVDVDTVDCTITVTGATEFTNKSIFTIGVAKGLGIRTSAGTGTHSGAGNTTGTDTISRAVRTLGIGVESTDTYTLAVRVRISDTS